MWSISRGVDDAPGWFGWADCCEAVDVFGWADGCEAVGVFDWADGCASLAWEAGGAPATSLVVAVSSSRRAMAVSLRDQSCFRRLAACGALLRVETSMQREAAFVL